MPRVVPGPPTGGGLGLRLRTKGPGEPQFPGFGLLSLSGDDRVGLEAIRARATSLGSQIGDIVDRGTDGLALDVFDPDGTVIRFLTPSAPEGQGSLASLCERVSHQRSTKSEGSEAST